MKTLSPVALRQTAGSDQLLVTEVFTDVNTVMSKNTITVTRCHHNVDAQL